MELRNPLILFEADSHGIAEHGDAILAAIEAGAPLSADMPGWRSQRLSGIYRVGLKA